jgi:hypothetical protein
VSGVLRALFPGQMYDLPVEVVKGNDWLEPVEKQAEREPEEAKARGKRG